MDESQERMRERIEALERRVHMLERALRRAGFEQPTSQASDAPSSPHLPAPAPSSTASRFSPPSAPTSARPPAAPTSPASPPRRASDAPRSPNLERLVGGNAFLVLGALIVVAGAGLFLKLAWDEGWIARITPVWRCILAGLFGTLLLLVGEAGKRRFGRFGFTGFSAAGLGVLYATAYATYGVFGLVSPVVAFWMVLGVCALGIAMGVRARSAWLGVLSLTGGYLAPIIVQTPDPPVWGLAAHLVALLAIGSVLALRAPRQRPLATASWWGTFVLGAFWLAGLSTGAPGVLSLGFIGVVWGMVVGRQLLQKRPRRLSDFRLASTLITTASTTLWALTGALFIAERDHLFETWIASAAITGVTLFVGLFAVGGWFGLDAPMRTRRGIVGVTLCALAGASLALTFALAFEEAWVETIAWGAVGLASVAAAGKTRVRPAVFYGVALLGLATLRALDMPLSHDPLLENARAWYGLVFTPWMALIAGLALAWLACGRVAGSLGTRHDADGRSKVWPRSIWDALSGVSYIAGAVLLGVCVLHRDAEPRGLMLGWAALAVLACALGRWRPFRNAAVAGVVYTALAALAWIGAFPPGRWSESATPPLLHPGLGWSLALAAVWFVAVRTAASVRPDQERDARRASWLGLGALLLISTTLEVYRVTGTITTDATFRAGAVSVWWALVAVGTLVAGVVRRAAWARYAGIALLLVATGKLLTYDVANLSPPVRIASFLVLGITLLGVAAGYLRTNLLRPGAGARRDGEPEGGDRPR